METRVSKELINGIHHCPFLDQQLNDLTMALLRRMPQRSMALKVQEIHAASERNEETYHFLGRSSAKKGIP